MLGSYGQRPGSPPAVSEVERGGGERKGPHTLQKTPGWQGQGKTRSDELGLEDRIVIKL